MAVENFKLFEMAQCQFDNVANLLGLDEATCTSSRAPDRELHSNIPVRATKYLLLLFIFITVSFFFSSSKAVADIDMTGWVLIGTSDNTFCYWFEGHTGCLRFRDFTYRDANGDYHVITWISGNLNGNDTFAVNVSPRIGVDTTTKDHNYDVALHGADVTIYTADDKAIVNVYNTRTGTLVKNNIPIVPNSSNLISVDDISSPYTLQIISEGRIVFQSQFITNYSTKLTSGGN